MGNLAGHARLLAIAKLKPGDVPLQLFFNYACIADSGGNALGVIDPTTNICMRRVAVSLLGL
jgi:hypothetical protein